MFQHTVVACLASVLVSTFFLRQGGPSLTVGAVEVNGARRYSKAEVVRVSGLQTGKTVSVDDLNAATARMAKTGLFNQLNYRYATAAGRTTITFDIEESAWTMPVVFDNLIWFTDEALVAALRETVPSFDGTAPVTEGFMEFLARELQTLIESRKIPGSVSFAPQGSLSKGIESFAFKVATPSPKICSMTFAGASAIKEADLKNAVGFGPNTEYSRSYLASVSRGTLTNLYRQRGHWRAAMALPTATFEKSAECSGAAVTVTVDEGAPYQWDRADWAGHAAFAAADLDKLMPLKSGDLANITVIDDGIRRVQKAYGTRGYIMERASYTPRLNDSTHRAVFEVGIVEGPQFRLGTVSFHGLDPKGVETLNKEWKLKPGDVFDASYPGTFFDDAIRPRLRPSTTPPSTKLDVDEKNRIVNVGFVFGG